MKTLTKLEKDLLEIFLPTIDGSNEFVFQTVEKETAKKLGWSVNTTKGIIGSLEKKDIIWTEGEFEDGISKRKLFHFSMTVNDDDGEMPETQKEEVNTIEKMEKYLTEREEA